MAARRPVAAQTRAYRSPRRARQAADTRTAVVTAAAELFAARGWAGTGMRDVAESAGVAVETAYAYFRSKADLLMAAVDAGVVGDTAAVPLAERPEFTALGTGSRLHRVAAAADLMTSIHRRTCGLHLALREGAAANADLAAGLRADEERRRTSVAQAAALVAGRELTEEERDGLWAVLSVEVYHLLTNTTGWTADRYRAWLATAIDALLPRAVRSR